MSHLQVKDLSFSYNIRGHRVAALERVNLEVEFGEICAVCGPSGGGKSTLLNLLSGVLTGYDGEVLLGGRVIDPQAMQVALVPQSYGLFPWKTVRQNILLPEMLGCRSLDRQELEEILHILGLRPLLDRYPHELSGGQRQRVALSRAFAMKPDLLLLDEPFNALDIVTREQSYTLFQELWQRYPTTTILVTHSPSEAKFLAHRSLVLSGNPGRVYAEMKPIDASLLEEHLKTTYRQHDED